MEISIIIPVYNEEGSIKELHNKLTRVISKITSEYEIIFVDDGSTDSTRNSIVKLQNPDDHVHLISFPSNKGKSAALTAGFKAAKGELVFTMDGDLQDEPEEIPRFIEKLNTGYDVVTGWKFIRYDPPSKTLPSKLFNWLTATITGAKVHDSNCGYKIYRKKVVKQLRLQKGFHRYIPAIVHWMGFQMGEIKVNHHPRVHGRSKYGPKRLITGTMDLVKLKFVYLNNVRNK
jgi:glycosyltransferase involved in cell wall biosynthesis